MKIYKKTTNQSKFNFLKHISKKTSYQTWVLGWQEAEFINYKWEISAPQELSKTWLKKNNLKADYAFEVWWNLDEKIFSKMKSDEIRLSKYQ